MPVSEGASLDLNRHVLERGDIRVERQRASVRPMQTVLKDEAHTWTMPSTDPSLLTEKLTITEHATRRMSPNGSAELGAEAAVGGPKVSRSGMDDRLTTSTPRIIRRHSLEFQAFQHQGGIRHQQGQLALDAFGTQLDDWSEAL